MVIVVSEESDELRLLWGSSENLRHHLDDAFVVLNGLHAKECCNYFVPVPFAQYLMQFLLTHPIVSQLVITTVEFIQVFKCEDRVNIHLAYICGLLR